MRSVALERVYTGADFLYSRFVFRQLMTDRLDHPGQGFPDHQEFFPIFSGFCRPQDRKLLLPEISSLIDSAARERSALELGSNSCMIFPLGLLW